MHIYQNVKDVSHPQLVYIKNTNTTTAKRKIITQDIQYIIYVLECIKM